MATISNELLQASHEASIKYNIPQSVILGFAGLETNFGTAGTGKSKNNVFGIMNGDGVAKNYASVTESVEDFARLVTGNKDSSQSQKYGNATANATTNSEWVYAITGAGYNSEYETGVYEEKVLNVIDSYKLTKYDSTISGVTTNTTDKTVSENIGLKWWGDVVIVVFAVILIIAGVAFVALSVTKNSFNPLDKVTEIAKGVTKE